MALETGTYINDLAPSNPQPSDPAGQGDDHLRLIKATLQGSLPNFGGVIGQARVLSTTQTISAVWNTSLIVDGTAGLVLTLPAVASITAGWYVNFMTRGAGTIVLTPQSGSSINSSATYTVPSESFGIVVFQGGATWLASAWPNGTGAANFPNGVSISGASVINGALSISGATVINGAASLLGAVTISGASTFLTKAEFKAGVSISGAVNVTGALNVAGAATIVGNATMNGTVTISGAATLLGALTVGGAAQLNSTVTISGVATLLTTLNVRGGASISGAANFVGDVAIGGNITSGVTISGQTVLNGLTVQGAMTVSGVATFLGAVAIVGNVTTSMTISGTVQCLTGLIVDGAATFNGAMSISGLASIRTINLTGGQIQFPAAQNASANANTLDDYEEGTFTPAITFDVPGNLAVAYTLRVAVYTKIGNVMHFAIRLLTSTFTWTTASGNVQVTGLPFFAKNNALNNSVSVAYMSGSSVSGVDFSVGAAVNAGLNVVNFYLFSVQAGSVVSMGTAFMPSATQKEIVVGGSYFTD